MTNWNLFAKSCLLLDYEQLVYLKKSLSSAERATEQRNPAMFYHTFIEKAHQKYREECFKVFFKSSAVQFLDNSH